MNIAQSSRPLSGAPSIMQTMKGSATGQAQLVCLPPSRDCDFLKECGSVVNETRAVTLKKTSEISVALGR